LATDFVLPELGEQIASGDVLRVLVKAGDTLVKDQAVLELETDKATIEVPSSVAGVVKEIKVKAGDKVKVGQAILSFDANGSASPKQADAPAAPTKADEAAPKQADEVAPKQGSEAGAYTHLRAHDTRRKLVCPRGRG
jgi:pyruvate dehydrogenase E2 component (dihydrolipoamide acetyltransferase)